MSSSSGDDRDEDSFEEPGDVLEEVVLKDLVESDKKLITGEYKLSIETNDPLESSEVWDLFLKIYKFEGDKPEFIGNLMCRYCTQVMQLVIGSPAKWVLDKHKEKCLLLPEVIRKKIPQWPEELKSEKFFTFDKFTPFRFRDYKLQVSTNFQLRNLLHSNIWKVYLILLTKDKKTTDYITCRYCFKIILYRSSDENWDQSNVSLFRHFSNCPKAEEIRKLHNITSDKIEDFHIPKWSNEMYNSDGFTYEDLQELPPEYDGRAIVKVAK